MTALQAIGIAILQGATELFPISSLGHAVVVPALLRWPLDQHAPSFLPFLVLLHLGTAAALLAYFWRDWLALLLGILGLRSAHESGEARRVFMLIVIATIPAVIIGGALEHFLRRLFGSPLVAAAFLVVNGAILLWAERLRSRGAAVGAVRNAKPLSAITPGDALAIGFWQCLALIPGLSRSGATIVGGLLRGLDHAGAAHFSFLIALPVILAATALEVPKLFHAGLAAATLQSAGLAAVVAGVVAWLSTAFLMRYFREHDRWALDPFAWYCVAAGAASLVLLRVGL
ncbi:MAG: undecaprenyl-diphosphate phosphatase [Acetobacteraceae bacterium]|nr:undecaprenyl-diphosphate phosphatase [Acetobacteraceae bacterium]